VLFAMLTLIYISVAAAGHDDHIVDEHHEHGMIGAIETAAEDMAVGVRG
jgi:hypothetical protein